MGWNVKWNITDVFRQFRPRYRYGILIVWAIVGLWEYADSDFWDTPGFESKIVSAHIVHIDVYDLDNQTYIGRWTLDPGDFGSDLMLEEALDEMIKATSDDTVLDFIESMPEA